MEATIRFDLGCKVVEGSGCYDHSFGGENGYEVVYPNGAASPISHPFDLKDPAFPVKFKNGPRHLPLFFAFNYDCSPMSYRVVGDNRIEVLGIDSIDGENTCSEFPEHFEFRHVVLNPIDYEEQRDISMAWFIYSHPEIYEKLPKDELIRLKTLYPVTRIGMVHDLIQLPRGEPCQNRKCKRNDERFYLQAFATIPERPFPDCDLWNSDGSTIQIVFELCKDCGSIRTYNTWD